MGELFEGANRQYKPLTRVVFRKWSDGGVIAFFPGDEEDKLSRGRFCGSYMHMGQHGSADMALMHRLKPADPEDYASLKAELESIGYRLQVEP